MAPVTRRRTKALGSASATRDENPSPSSSKQKRNENDASEKAVATPRRKDLAVRTREEDDEPSSTGADDKKHEAKTRQRRGKRSTADTPRDSQEKKDSPAVYPSEPNSASRQLFAEAEYRASLGPEGPASSPNAASQKKQPGGTKGKHIVFGEDDDDNDGAANLLATATHTKVAPADNEENPEESDDDAPEEVSTQAATKATLKSEQAAQEAAAKQAATQKRKRQERDALLKTQAQQKRKREEEEEETSAAQKKPKTSTVGSRQRFAPRNGGLPDVLPDEFLTDSSSDEENDEDESLLRKLPNNKITFDAALETREKLDENQRRRPEMLRDQVVGETLYRVADPTAAKKKGGNGGNGGKAELAARMNKGTRNVKEDMMRRNRSGVQANKRKGFFVRK